MSSGLITVKTYEQLRSFSLPFATGDFIFAVFLGRPGVGKTEALRRAMGNRPHHFLNSHVTAAAMVESLRFQPSLPVILDDVDTLWKDAKSRPVLKAMCDSKPEREVHWHTMRTVGAGMHDVMSEPLIMTGPVAVICNAIPHQNADMKAVLDRGLQLEFSPSNAEVHREAGEWFDDPAVYAHVGRHLDRATALSLRVYQHGSNLRRTHPEEWGELVQELLGINEQDRVLLRYLHDPSLPTIKKQQQAYTADGHGAERTFYRRKKALEERAASNHESGRA